ncbi:N-acetylglucosamine kinase [Devosia subaequoris]|uniref:N-acetylglucosamine kinase n=1 Tax=Devosia subaequoris TaxID=395930 RepID=A0A7W6INP6_9HYPH|nr:ROK family protein [Devosia subaequoris]MBB4052938.1 N-acetylglucosamine kinase [Devosia subaequoris]MCP1210357.1 ROK family protein [Devosia subaequoris]
MITCFDIGGTTIKAATATGPDALVPLGRVPTPRDNFEAFAAAVANLIEKGGAPTGSPISISVTGVVDPETGLVTVANIPCIDGHNLAGDLGARLGCQVLVANDADCFALAEAFAGAGRGHRVVFGAILGTGVGGGIVADGRLFRGGGGLSGEWGHGTAVATGVSVPPFDMPHLPCGCGLEGCVDTVGGARGIEKLHKHLHGTDLPSTDIVAQWEDGGAQAAQTLDLYVELVSLPLALTVNIVGPDIIPVGGGLGNAHGLVSRLDVAVRRRILRNIDRPLVVPAQLTVDAGLIGAASLAFSEGVA